MLKHASEMSEAELREAFSKLEAARAKKLARNQERRQGLTTEQKAKRSAYSKAYRERQQAIRDRAKELGFVCEYPLNGEIAATLRLPPPQDEKKPAKKR
jgi:hypothetical protein